MNNLPASWATFPRAVKWAVSFGVALVLYFALAEPMLNAWNKWNSLADAKEAQVRRFVEGERSLKATGTSVLLGVSRYGRVEYPKDPELRAVEFNRVVSEVMNKHGVRNYTSTSRTATLPANAPLAQAAGQDYKVERIVKDIQFDAEPEAVTAIIADFERQPVVSTLSRVQIRRADARDASSRTVKATLAVESWTIAKKGKTR